MKRNTTLGFYLVLSLLATFAVLPECALGQQVTAAITGRVTDPSDAAIAGATVRATDADRARLSELSVLLDQCWDLLHQRRGLRDANLDPDEATARPAEVVEGYTTDTYDG